METKSEYFKNLIYKMEKFIVVSLNNGFTFLTLKLNEP